MKIPEITTQVFPLLRKHWFNVAIGALILFIVIKKDLTFSVNFNNPAQPELVEPPIKHPVSQKGKKKELITEHQQATASSSIMDKFNLSNLFGGNRKSDLTGDEWTKTPSDIQQAYLKRFAHVAMSEQKKFGVPASIILANSMIHSFAGTREMAKAGHNHFNLPCTLDWQGAQGSYHGKCYRHYENAWMSFRDHSIFVTSGKFAELQKIAPTDYKSWANALEQKGFSKTPNLSSQLIQLIEQYELQHLDTLD